MMMMKEELLLSKVGRECSVTEMMELERKIYQENIERNQKIHEELRSGTLKEFRNKCQPFEEEQKQSLLRAKVHLQLNQKNINDLLAFDLQQAKDVYEYERLQLKKRLLGQAQQRLTQLKRRLNMTSVNQPANRSRSTTTTTNIQDTKVSKTLVNDSGELDAARLKQSIQDTSTFAREKFNLRHLEPCMPSSDQILDQVTQVLTDYKSFFASEGSTYQDTITVNVDEEKGIMEIDGVVYKPEDDVILTSSLSNEELSGKIVVILKDHIEVILVCDTPVQVTVDKFRQGKCTIRMDTTIRHYLDCPSENIQRDATRDQLKKFQCGRQVFKLQQRVKVTSLISGVIYEGIISSITLEEVNLDLEDGTPARIPLIQLQNKRYYQIQLVIS